jgi:hypothetical protein
MPLTITSVNRGSAPGDNTGSNPYVAFGIVNDNDAAIKVFVDSLETAVGLNTTHRGVANIHLDWSAASVGVVHATNYINWASASVGTIHATNYVDNDTTYVNSDWDHDQLTGFVAQEHIRWDLTNAANIHANNYTDTGDTTYVNSDWDHNQLTNYVAQEHIRWDLTGTGTIHGTNYTNTTYINSDWDHDQLTGFVAQEHIRWDLTGTGTIHSTNYTNTVYTLPLATDLIRGGVELYSNVDQAVASNAVSSTASRTYGIQLNAANQMVVNVPWSDGGSYTLPLATASVRGGLELGSDTVQSVSSNTPTNVASRSYALQLNSVDRGVINVPWVNTTYNASNFIDLVSLQTAAGNKTWSGNAVFNATFTSRGINDDGTSTAITITSAEKVGVGTATPNSNLTSSVDAINTPYAFEVQNRRNSGTADYGVGINFKLASLYQTQEIYKSAVIKCLARSAWGNTTALAFHTQSSAPGDLEPAEAMRIDYNGRVGIGVTIPTVMLDVNGGIKATTLDTTGLITGTTTTQSANDNSAKLASTAYADAAGGGGGGDGTVTNVSAGNAGLTVANGTTTPSITLDFSEFVEFSGTWDHSGGTIATEDSFVVWDVTNAAARRILTGNVQLSGFNNDAGFVTSAVTSVSAGSGMTFSTITGTGSVSIDTTQTAMTSWYNTSWRAGYSSSNYIDSNLSALDIVFDSIVDARFSDGGALIANGNITAYSGTISSDRKLKKDFAPIKNAISKVQQLTGYEYKMRRDNKLSAGLIAQDVQKILPQAVETENDLRTDEEYLTLNYNAVIGLLVQAVNELTEEVRNGHSKQ